MKYFLGVLLACLCSAVLAAPESELGEYKEGGKGAVPTFTFEIPFNGYGTKQFIDPLGQACTRLNNYFFKKNTAGGKRTCTLVKYSAVPKSLVERTDGDQFTHVYTAPALGKESLRFVMKFGEQTVNVHSVLLAKSQK